MKRKPSQPGEREAIRGIRTLLQGVPLLLFLFFSSALSAEPSVHFVTTISPVASLVRAITAGRAHVTVLVPPGFSPALYELTPSDLMKVSHARALLLVDSRMDGWATRLPVSPQITLSALIPSSLRLPFPHHSHSASRFGEHSHEEGNESLDPHFWSDPLTVHAMIPPLVEALCRSDGEGCALYRKQGEEFRKELLQLHREMAALLEPVRGKKVVLFHPSFQYLLKRYGLELAAVIEPYPGKEPSPRYLQEVIRTIRSKRVKVIFTEPQLPVRPARIIAESAGVKVFELDPLGGTKGRESYRELMLHNGRELRSALAP